MKYTKEHEWLRDDGAVGITDFAQAELGELVFVDLPKVGQQVKKGEPFCVVESTKAASDVYAPVSGKVIEVNSELASTPSLINSSATTAGWIAKLAPASGAFDSGELGALMDEGAYNKHIKKA